jgi:hypothetical protein
MVKILFPAVKNGLIILKNVAEGALPEKNASGPPPGIKAAPDSMEQCYKTSVDENCTVCCTAQNCTKLHKTKTEQMHNTDNCFSGHHLKPFLLSSCSVSFDDFNGWI